MRERLRLKREKGRLRQERRFGRSSKPGRRRQACTYPLFRYFKEQ